MKAVRISSPADMSRVIQYLRKKRGMPVLELSRRSGVQRSTLENFLYQRNDTRIIFALRTLEALDAQLVVMLPEEK